jgi:para-nitrobenzyl esterase
MTGPVVMTAAGAVAGIPLEGVFAFKGVPYGAPTGHAARFLLPEPPVHWNEVRDARSMGPACPQPLLTAGDAVVNEELMEIFAASGFEEEYDEDCLTVNVWTPSCEGATRPILVWLHGGAWTIGSANLPIYDGARLARRGDAVVVGVNHRLGAFGYLGLHELGDERYASSGMAGVLDIVAALQWVRDNVAAFGGDPGNVTIFGESGGGAKVSTLLGVPSARGLFHRAVVQSGPMLRGVPPDKAAATTTAIAARLGVSSVEELMQVPADRLVEVQTEVIGGPLGGFGSPHALGPVVDGRALPGHPYDPEAAASAAGVPLLIGTTRDEMTLFLAAMPGFADLVPEAEAMVASMVIGGDASELVDVYRRTRPDATPAQRLVAVSTDRLFRAGSIHLAERHRAAGGDVYMYRLDFTSTVMGGQLGAPHALDIGFVFDNLHASLLHGSRPEAQALADQMSEAWLAFARTGDPNHPGLPVWPVYDEGRRATMVFDVECTVADDPDAEERQAWTGRETGL